MLVGAGLVAAGAIVATALWPLPRRSRGLERQPLPAPRPGPLTVALALLVPLTVVALLAAPGSHRRDRATPSLPPMQTHLPRSAPPASHGRGGADGAAALASGIAAGLLGLALFAAVGRRGRVRGLPDEARAIVAAGTHDALAALTMPSDPRSAVLVAYARMESALAAAGLQRRPSEAPREYLDRLAARLGVARKPAALLTALFERARFSTHPVDEPMRRAALGALERIADDLGRDRS